MKKLFVLFGAVVLVVAFTAPAFAAEWSFYGSARMSMFWTSRDLGDFEDPNGDDTDTDILHALQGNSRIGANVKAGDNLTGRFEYGTGVNLRILWGEYDFGGFKLGVGQHYTPAHYFLSNQVIGSDTGMLGWGGMYSGRQGMVQAKIGGFRFALVSPVSSTNIFDPVSGTTFTGFDTDISWPKLEACYIAKWGAFSGKILGGYNQYKVVGATQEETLDSYVLGIGGKFTFGPFYVGGDLWTGKNVGNYGWATGGADGNASWDAVDEKLVDNTGFGWLFVVGFTMSDMFSFEGGLGQAMYDLDISGADDAFNSAWYIQANIGLAKGVFIVPEIGQFNNGDDISGNDIGQNTYYGLKWQINF